LFDIVKGWEQTVIKSRGEDGEEVEARISLPAMPSPYVVAFLFAGCREIHGIGGHVLDRAVLELFAWQLLEKVCFYFLQSFPNNCCNI
jgi:hypothetical protein